MTILTRALALIFSALRVTLAVDVLGLLYIVVSNGAACVSVVSILPLLGEYCTAVRMLAAGLRLVGPLALALDAAEVGVRGLRPTNAPTL